MQFYSRISLLVLALLGTADTAYLLQSKLVKNPLVCGSFSGCDIVSASPYSYLFGMPLALYGFIFYVAVFIAVALADRLRDRLLSVLAILSLIGAAASVYFLFVQYVLIEAFCPYCVASAGLSIIIFLIVMWSLFRKPQPQRLPDSE